MTTMVLSEIFSIHFDFAEHQTCCCLVKQNAIRYIDLDHMVSMKNAT